MRGHVDEPRKDRFLNVHWRWDSRGSAGSPPRDCQQEAACAGFQHEHRDSGIVGRFLLNEKKKEVRLKPVEYYMRRFLFLVGIIIFDKGSVSEIQKRLLDIHDPCH